MSINYNIKDAKFFIDTINLFQRNDLNLYNKLILLNFSSEKEFTLEEKEKELDIIVLKDFIKDSNVSLSDTLEEIKETFFLENVRFKNYFSHIYESKEKLKEELNILLDINRIDKENISVSIINNLDNIRKKINENSNGRKRFSFLKDSIEIISRTDKIINTLNKLNIKITKEEDYIFHLKIISDKLLKEYLKENSFYEESLGEPKFVKELIENLSSEIQNNIQSFQVLKNNPNFENDYLIFDKKELKEISRLQGKGSAAGSDYKYRIKKVLLDLILENNNTKNKDYKVLTKAEKIKLKEITKEKEFAKDLRNLLIKTLEIHKFKVLKNSDSLFINYKDINKVKFLIDKDCLNSYLNITLNIENENNLPLYNLILNIQNLNNDNIIGFLNDKPLIRLKTLSQYLLKDINYKEKTRIKEEINNINNLKYEIEFFNQKYGDLIGKEIEEEFIKLFNYSLFIKENLQKLDKLTNSNINLKEYFKADNIEYKYNTIEEIINFINIDKKQKFINTIKQPLPKEVGDF